MAAAVVVCLRLGNVYRMKIVVPVKRVVDYAVKVRVKVRKARGDEVCYPFLNLSTGRQDWRGDQWREDVHEPIR